MFSRGKKTKKAREFERYTETGMIKKTAGRRFDLWSSLDFH